MTTTDIEPGLILRLAVAAGDIKLAHSVFALPFAVLAGSMAVGAESSPAAIAGKLVLIVICMFFARSWAMMVNRLVDRRFDAENPRTAGRALVAGRLRVRDAWVITVAAGLAFWVGAAMFWTFFGNLWPAALALPVLLWIAFYSLTKRFTALCHVFLGGALAASPLAAAVAVEPASLGNPAIWWLSAMVLLWVAGFDVIYAIQDIAFDRDAGLRSVPARLGVGGAAWVSRGLHAGALAALILAWENDPRFGVVFGAGVVLIGLLLILEHVVLARRGEAGLDMAFFTLNGVVSVVLGISGLVDLVL